MNDGTIVIISYWVLLGVVCICYFAYLIFDLWAGCKERQHKEQPND